MTAPVEQEIKLPPGHDLVHFVCGDCNDSGRVPLLAFCGTDVTEEPTVEAKDYGPRNCAMCDDLIRHGGQTKCPGCGIVWCWGER